MWVRAAAIRPVPKFAVVSSRTLEEVERQLAADSEQAREDLDDAFSRFEKTQPVLAERISHVLSAPLDETALALGYFLSIAIWLSFERAFNNRLREVSEDALAATETALALEEQLRADNGAEPFDFDDVVAIEQPGVLAFVHEHLDAALDVGSRDAGGERDIDVDDVHTVYRAILVLILSLSHAVIADNPTAHLESHELLA